jgi:hypothetical protein
MTDAKSDPRRCAEPGFLGPCSPERLDTPHATPIALSLRWKVLM